MILNNNYIQPLVVEEGHMSNQEEPHDTGSKTREKHDIGVKHDGRFYKFVKKHFLHRKSGATNVQEIHILPEGDELRWARRSAGSGISRSSEVTCTTNTQSSRMEVVNDLADEHLPESV